MHSASDTVHSEDPSGQYESMNQQITRKVFWFFPLKSPVLSPFPGIIPVFNPLTLEYKCKTVPTADFILKETEKNADLSINNVLQNYFTFLQYFLKEASFCNPLLSFSLKVWYQSWYTETSLYFYTPVVCLRSE